MTSVVVVGAGVGGLAAGLFAARRGHPVVIVERDPPPPSIDIDDTDVARHRRGVPQAVQSHTFLARCVAVLRAEAPDVLQQLERRTYRMDFTRRFAAGDIDAIRGDDTLWAMGCRRRTFERILQVAVEAETNITLLWDAGVEALVGAPGRPHLPRITGIRTSAGDEIAADLVVDASGCRTRATTWIRDATGEGPRETADESGVTYFTRWYRLRDGCDFPSQRRLPYADGQFATVATFPADDGVFSLTYMAPRDEPHRRALRDEAVFEAVLSRFTLTEPWLDPGLAQPVSEVRMMPGGRERRLDLTDDGRPLAAGFTCIGDAALSTNPTRGRGSSMAFLHAQLLADLLPLAAEDSVRFAAIFDATSRRELWHWYDSTVAFDRSRAARLATGLKQPFPQGVDSFELAVCAFSYYAERDEVLYRALVQILNMLPAGQAAMEDPTVQTHLASAMSRWGQRATIDGPDRDEFERICGRHKRTHLGT